MAARALGKRLKEFRLARLWTQRQLAASIGLHVITVNRIEKGHPVTDLTKAKIEKYLESIKVEAA